MQQKFLKYDDILALLFFTPEINKFVVMVLKKKKITEVECHACNSLVTF